MKKFTVLLFLIFLITISFAQSTIGITGIRDTSYSTYSAYISTKKSHPDIQIAGPFNLKTINTKKDIVYCSSGNRKLLLDVFSPKAKSKKPRVAIMIIHGGGWRTGEKSQHHPLAEKLADLGYVCFTPEYRLSTEALYPAAVYDLKAALRWIHANAKQYNIDTSKIAVAGFSAGGELAVFLGTTMGKPEFEKDDCHGRFSSNLQAVIDMDGTLSFVHPESGEGDDSKRTSAATYWFGYPKKDNLTLWEDASPLKHVSSRTPPTLFINSSVDRMHAGRTDYINVLSRHNIYTEVKTFEGSPHSFPLFHPWFEPTIKYMDEFLKKVFPSK